MMDQLRTLVHPADDRRGERQHGEEGGREAAGGVAGLGRRRRRCCGCTTVKTELRMPFSIPTYQD
jgi:hypothetical protein